MSRPKLVAIPCKLAPGMFSGERVFSVELANGQEYKGIAPRQFCWNTQGRIVAQDEPADEVDGMVAAKRVVDLERSQVAVEVADGVVIAVHEGRVKPRPTEIRPPRTAQAEP